MKVYKNDNASPSVSDRDHVWINLTQLFEPRNQANDGCWATFLLDLQPCPDSNLLIVAIETLDLLTYDVLEELGVEVFAKS